MTDNLESIILSHQTMYPEMEITDFIKLIYQNEFGGGHLIKDKNTSLNYLKQEYESLNNESENNIISIGNDIVRVSLKKLSQLNISIEEFNDMFVLSASDIKGSITSLKSKFEILLNLAKSNKIKFSYNEIRTYLIEYENRNFPLVSHSKKYKEKYHPNYRIIHKKYLEQYKGE